MTALPTNESFDFSHYAIDSSLLSESLTLSSLSSSTSSTPPLPAGCMIPLSTIIGQHDGPVLSRCSSLPKICNATLTSPTSPRLRTMLKEKLLIQTWLTGVVSDEVSNHTPWGGLDDVEPVAWKSEGSMYTPHVFKTKMALARRSKIAHSKEPEPTPSVSFTSPPDIRHRVSNRNALVFEREIILTSGGQSSRVSLQASADAMDADVVAMLSELQDLNSFFKKEDESVSDLPPPPALIVSNSHFSLPVSFESSGKLVPDATLPLAARRGKKMLPPLSTIQLSNAAEYPSMPTAFLGSPSTYSPEFDFASHSSRSSMDLEQMVTSLRSRCAPIDPGTPSDVVEVEGVKLNGEEDEWAFADGLVDFYSPAPLDSGFVKKPLFPDLVDYAEGSLTDKRSALPRRASLTANPPPTTPLPPCPTIQRASVRSILKTSKSVRFASLPHGRSDSVEIQASPAPRRSAASSIPEKQRPFSVASSRSVRSTIHDPLRSPPPKVKPIVRSLNQKRATTPASFGFTTSAASSPSKPCAAAAGSSSKKAATGGRHSLRRVLSNDKENKGTSSDASPNTRWTLNEKVLRRASVGGAQIQTQKTRMPVPLRNILTRFK